jgi:hypothetical protein
MPSVDYANRVLSTILVSDALAIIVGELSSVNVQPSIKHSGFPPSAKSHRINSVLASLHE